MKRLSAAFVALLILVLSATAVFASRGALVADRTAQVHVDTQEASETPETPEATETPKATETESADQSESPKSDTSGSAGSTHPENHGAVVSAAAQASTPSKFENHGRYLSSIARQNAGHSGGHGRH